MRLHTIIAALAITIIVTGCSATPTPTTTATVRVTVTAEPEVVETASEHDVSEASPLEATMDEPWPFAEPFEYHSIWTEGDTFDVALENWIVVPPDGSDPGCFILTGTVTPTHIVEGSVSDVFSLPHITLFGDGRVWDEWRYSCGGYDRTLADAGYAPLDEAQVTEGTSYKFWEAYGWTDADITMIHMQQNFWPSYDFYITLQ